MNEIKLQLRAHHFDNDPLGYLVVEAQVDQQPVANFDECAIDLHQFERSLKKDGEYFIITCWCGNPVCANIQSGVSVQHDGHTVRWEAVIHGEARSYEFDKTAYLTAQKNLLLQAEDVGRYLKLANDGELTIVPIHNRIFFKR